MNLRINDGNGEKKVTFAGFAISVVGALAWTFVALLMTMPLWGMTPDPFALVRSVCRIVVIVPLAAVLSISFVKVFDMMAPTSWIAKVGEDPLASGIALGVLIYSVFNIAISG